MSPAPPPAMPRTPPGRNLWLRLGSTLILVPLCVGSLFWLPPLVFDLLLVVVAVGAAWEFGGMLRRGGIPHFPRTGALCAALVPVCAFPLVPARWPPILTAAAGALVAGVALGARDRELSDRFRGLVTTLFAGAFFGGLVAAVVGLHHAPDAPGSPLLVLFLLTVVWIGDTTAYGVGSRWGRRRLAPRVSPNKTVAGAVGQVVGSTATAIAFSLGAGEGWPFPLWGSAVLGAGLAGLAILGDLTESLMKRGLGVKDSGHLIPGHGGLLDRIDSFFFTAPALYGLVRLLALP